MSAIEHAHRTGLNATIGRPPDVEALSVVAVTFRRGEGCCDEDPVRMVVAYYRADNGELLAERDLWADEHSLIRRAAEASR